MKNDSKKTAHTVLHAVLVAVTLAVIVLLQLLSRALDWAAAHFGNIGMDEIMFTINMPLEGSGSGFIEDFISTVVSPVMKFALVLVLAVVLLSGILRRKDHRRSYEFHCGAKGKVIRLFPLRFGAAILVPVWLLCGVWTVRLVNDADEAFGFKDFIFNQIHQSSFIEEEFVDPKEVSLTFPEQKRNLVYILLESGESSAQDTANGGLFNVNYIPHMTQLAKDNISFSQSDLVEGAAVAPACGWTAAGIVAEFSGVPLKLYQYDDSGAVDNSMGQYQSFLPGVTALGDILAEQGYHNYFMCGSEIHFGGRDKFLSQHGDYEFWDLNTAKEKGKIPQDYYVWWGFEDAKLYEYAKEELTRLSQEDAPFNFSMLTVDTHHVGGYFCPLCQEQWDEPYGNVWSCADRQLWNFIGWCKEQPFYENTTFVISGDHCSMDPVFYADYAYDKHHGETLRKVYNCIINPAVEPEQEHNRKFVTMDLFPTTLAAMGVQIDGNRLGLGTNLFSGQQTLAEEYGYQQMFDELNRKSLFYDTQLLYPD